MLKVQTALKISNIHGIGLFAAEFIEKGQLVARYTPGLDILIGPDRLDCEDSESSGPMKEFLRMYSYWDEYKKMYVLSVDNSRFINHSRTPNLYSPNTPEEFDCLYSLRDIEPGEELTEDYSTWNDPYWTERVRILDLAESSRVEALIG